MPTKTTVTNDPVAESGNIVQSQSAQSGEGQIPLNEKEIENRIRENLRGEYARKTDELSNELNKAKAGGKTVLTRLNAICPTRYLSVKLKS